jgi:site-specific DNA recombinase
MQKAVLYARVSTDRQEKEGTIESQLFELKRQIAAAGHELVKEYIDDGHSGKLLDRPALNTLRADLKINLFDTVYFHSADRIARAAAYQTIIVDELLKHGKKIIIGGKDYRENPENKLTLTMLGAFAEYERSKIMERTERGRLHRLRMGEMSSSGHRIYGYHYLKKTPTAPATLVINEEQAAIVLEIFEMFASGGYGLVNICRFLEEGGILTRGGKTRWDNDRVKSILKNETYTGTRYYNRMTAVTDSNRESKEVVRGKWVIRDRSEWIPVKVPVIVSRELFDQVQKRLRQHDERYCTPVTHHLLSGLVQCGVCGSACSSSRRYHKVVQPSGKVSVYHRAIYRCNRQALENMHDRTRIERCSNSRIGTHILEGKVFEMIRDTMLHPAMLRGCIDGGGGLDDKKIARRLARVAENVGAVEDERRRLIDRYACEKMTGEEYIAANRALDRDMDRLTRQKAELVAALRSPHQEDFVDASVRQFCATANARMLACTDSDAKREFLVAHVERVIYNRYQVTVMGSVPVQSATGETKLQFRIAGEIDIVAVRSASGKIARRKQEMAISPIAIDPMPHLVAAE